jgi:hypothetical protein
MMHLQRLERFAGQRWHSLSTGEAIDVLPEILAGRFLAPVAL